MQEQGGGRRDHRLGAGTVLVLGTVADGGGPPHTLAVAVIGRGGRKWRVSYCRASAGGLGPPPWGCFPVLTWAGGPTCPTYFLEALSSTCRPSWFCLGMG